MNIKEQKDEARLTRLRQMEGMAIHEIARKGIVTAEDWIKFAGAIYPDNVQVKWTNYGAIERRLTLGQARRQIDRFQKKKRLS